MKDSLQKALSLQQRDLCSIEGACTRHQMCTLPEGDGKSKEQGHVCLMDTCTGGFPMAGHSDGSDEASLLNLPETDVLEECVVRLRDVGPEGKVHRKGGDTT